MYFQLCCHTDDMAMLSDIYSTDAPDEVLKEVAHAIYKDNQLGFSKATSAVLEILKIRGYKYEKIETNYYTVGDISS